MKTTQINTKKEKREITPHKGGRSVRINCRVTPKIKNEFLDLAKEKNMQQADYLEYLIKKEAEKG